MTVSKPKPELEKLYGDLPAFTFTPKSGEKIVFPASSTISGEVDGVGMLEFLWEMSEDELSDTDQMFAWLKRSGATRDMKRRVVRLSADELPKFFRKWLSEADPEPVDGLPPES